MDYETIKRIIKLVEESDITGLAVEEGGMRVEVRREKGGVITSSTTDPDGPVQTVSSSLTAETGEKLPPNVIAITAPMVGTFYRASSPDAKSYVEVGDQVDVGKVVCIIEAMKLFNEIESEVAGKVVKVLPENGRPVEYGQPLMWIEKSA